jgi:hypothetical protein
MSGFRTGVDTQDAGSGRWNRWLSSLGDSSTVKESKGMTKTGSTPVKEREKGALEIPTGDDARRRKKTTIYR